MRRKTRQVSCGKVKIGGGAPISIQSMTNTDTRDFEATLTQINALADAGVDIVRCTVPDEQAAIQFGKLKKQSPVPLVADIHFDYRLALAAIDAEADKIRINPGNIGSEDRVRQVLNAAKSAGIPIRIGVNSGSLEKDIIKKYGGVTAEGMAESAIKAAQYAQSFGFEDIVVSLKCSDVVMNHEAHKIFASKSDLPLHIGLTEAGFGEEGETKSIAALSALLLDGIGDTLRVSLTGDPVKEVLLAKRILKACGIRQGGIDFVSCPTCGRTEVDLEKIASEVKQSLMPLSNKLELAGRSLKVSVMGCVVNGPGEAREADYGIACGKNKGLVFKKGEIIGEFAEDSLVETLESIVLNDF